MRNQVRAHAAVGEIHQVKSGCARGKGEVGDADKIPVADAVVMLLESIQRAPQQTGVDLAVAAVLSAESETRPGGRGSKTRECNIDKKASRKYQDIELQRK